MMKKADGVSEAGTVPAVSILESEVQRRAVDEAAAEAAIVAPLHEQAGPAKAAGPAALETYAAMEQRYGPWLRVELAALKRLGLGRTRWSEQLGTAQARIEELLGYLAHNPDLIRHHLTELAGITARHAQSHRLGQLCDWVLAMADTGAQFGALVDGVRGRLAELERLLKQEPPDLTPPVGLASAGLDGPPSGPRRARTTLSGDDDA